MSSKLLALVDMVESGTKELEDRADELMPRFQQAMDQGRKNMAAMQSHIDRVDKSIKAVEDFNRRMSNMPPEDGETK